MSFSPRSLPAALGRRILKLEGRYALISFRMLILLLLFFFLIYGGNGWLKEGGAPWQILAALGALQFLSSAGLAFVPSRWFGKALFTALFLFDIALISYALYCTQGYQGDLFLVYFLVIFMAAIARKPSVSFSVAGLACLLYGALLLRSHPAGELMQPEILIRFPLLLVVGFFSSLLVHDVEAEKERLREEMQAYWMQSEKLAALGEMASGVALAISNPLTCILGTAQVAVNKSPRPCYAVGNESGPSDLVAVPRQDMEVIERNAMRCKKIVSDLLRFAAGHEFRFEPTDLCRTLLDALSLLQSRLRAAGVEVRWQEGRPPEPVAVKASRPHLEQIFFNLMRNAVEAMPKGGTLTLAVCRRKRMNRRNIPTEHAEVTIQDTGGGIPREAIEDLDQPFYSPDRRQKGKGFGLSVARHMIQKHNGELCVESDAENGGTKVCVRLPLAQSEAPQTAAEAPISGSGSQGHGNAA